MTTKKYGYCTNCKTNTEQKVYSMTYNIDSMMTSQDFECLQCHRIKTVKI